MPVMEWTEHAERSMFTLNADPDCWPHELSWIQPSSGEPMYRGGCRNCKLAVWVNYWPARQQGVEFEDLARFVEGIVNGG
jgi:hypothetical protein